jgi:hypothetical protein
LSPQHSAKRTYRNKTSGSYQWLNHSARRHYPPCMSRHEYTGSQGTDPHVCNRVGTFPHCFGNPMVETTRRSCSICFEHCYVWLTVLPSSLSGSPCYSAGGDRRITLTSIRGTKTLESIHMEIAILPRK